MSQCVTNKREQVAEGHTAHSAPPTHIERRDPEEPSTPLRDEQTTEDLLSIRSVFALKVSARRRGGKKGDTCFFSKLPPNRSVCLKNAETRRPRDGVFYRFADWDPSAQAGTPALHGLPHVHAVQTAGYPTSFIPLAFIVWYTSTRAFGVLCGTAHEHVLCQLGTGGAFHGRTHHDDAEFLGSPGQFLPTARTSRSPFERRRPRSETAGESALRGAAQPG